MRKLTQSEAFEYLKGKKTMVQDWAQSRNVQDKLFRAGFEWEDEGKQFSCTDMPFLFFDEDGFIGYASAQDYERFDASENEFVVPFRILDIEIVEEKKEPEFKFGQEVLVRDYGGKWVPAHFAFISKTDTIYPYVVFGGICFEECIALKGNEHLMGVDEEK